MSNEKEAVEAAQDDSAGEAETQSPALITILEADPVDLDTASMSMSDIAEHIRKRQAAFDTLRRRSVPEVWHVGRLLGALKEKYDKAHQEDGDVEHESWREWVESVGMKERTERRYRHFHQSFTLEQVESFNSVSEAFKALPPAPAPEAAETPSADVAAEEAPKLTAAEKRIIERDHLIEENEELKRDLRICSTTVEEKNQIINQLQDDARVADGFESSVSTIEDLQAVIRRKDSEIEELRTKNEELTRENRRLTYRMRDKDKQIRQLTDGQAVEVKKAPPAKKAAPAKKKARTKAPAKKKTGTRKAPEKKS